jgi:hypothetical protein
MGARGDSMQNLQTPPGKPAAKPYIQKEKEQTEKK